MLTEFAKLIKVPDLLKILEKSASGLKWKMIKEVFEKRKNGFIFIEEKAKILALEIFKLVSFPNLTRIISLKAATIFVTHENDLINPIVAILTKTILTLNHCRRVDKGSMRCCEQLLYIWLISHIETKKLIFNNF